MNLDFTGSTLFLVLLLFAAGLVCIIKGGDFFVDAATWIAEASGIPKFIIGATVVSFATTMPEMLVSVFSALEGNADIAVGNAVGSVTANTGLIMCLSLICMECTMPRRQYTVKAVLLLAAIAILFGFTRDGQLSILESVLILVIFVCFIAESLVAARREQTLEGPEAGERPKTDGRTVALNIGKFVFGAAAIVLGAQLLIDNGTALAQMVGVPDAIIGATMIAAGACHDHYGHPQKAVVPVGGQHHRREHYGPHAYHAAVRAHPRQAAAGRAAGHAAGHSGVSCRVRRCAHPGARAGQVQTLGRLFHRRTVYRVSCHHVHVLRRVKKPAPVSCGRPAPLFVLGTPRRCGGEYKTCLPACGKYLKPAQPEVIILI